MSAAPSKAGKRACGAADMCKLPVVLPEPAAAFCGRADNEYMMRRARLRWLYGAGKGMSIFNMLPLYAPLRCVKPCTLFF